MDLDELASQIECSAHPNRQHDLAIDLLLNPHEYSASVHETGNLGFPVSDLDYDEMPPYTLSMDAASNVVPPKWGFRVSVSENGKHVGVTTHTSHPINRAAFSEGDNMARCLCAAGLRARVFEAE